MKYGYVILACVMMSGCSSIAQRNAEQLCNAIGSLGPTTKDFFVKKWGPPAKCQPLQYGEVCEFYKDLGTSTSGPTIYNNGLAFQTTQTHQRYEMVRLEFDSKQVAQNWNCEVRY